MAVSVQKLAFPATMVVTVVMALGTTIFNLMEKSDEQAMNALKKSHDTAIAELNEEIDELKGSDTVLHQRISSVSERQRSLETNLAGYNATLTTVQRDLSEIKADIKELSRVDFSAALRNALRDLNSE